MNKIFRILSVLVAVSIICLSFSSCGFITDLRENKVVLNEDGNLEFKGDIYKKLADTEDIYFDYDYESEIIMSENDEPLLYSYLMGDGWCSISTDKVFIETFGADIYCREDKYESIADRIENGFEKEKYIYTYEVYEETDNFFDMGYEEEEYYLTETDLKAANEVFAISEPITNATEMSYNSDYWVEIYGCSDDLVLREHAFDIFVINDKYYLQRTDEYYNNIVYEVPFGYNEIFKNMMAKYVKSYDDMY